MENSTDMQELRNKLRMMNFPQDEILNIVRRQQIAIHKQRMANDTIHDEIETYQTQIARIEALEQSHKTNDQRIHLESQAKALVNKHGILISDVKAEEEKRKALEEAVSKERHKVGGMFAQSQHEEKNESRMKTMENKLDKTLLKYNKNLKVLGEMRDRIDELRKARMTYRSIAKESEQETQQYEQKMAQLIYDSNEMYTMRDLTKMELGRLKSREKEDIQMFEEEISRLNQQIDSQALIQRLPQDSQQSIPSMSSMNDSKDDQQDEITQMTDSFNEIVAETLRLCGVESLEKLLEQDEEADRENFSLMSFVVENNAARQQIEEELNRLKNLYEEEKRNSLVSEEEENIRLRDISKQVMAEQNKLDVLDKKKTRVVKENQRLSSLIKKSYEKLGLSWSSTPDSNDHLTTANTSYVLVTIEEKLQEMMKQLEEKATAAYYMEMQNSQDTNNLSETFTDSKSEISNARSFASQHKGSSNASDVVPKLPESNRPLSVEEMRKLLK